MSYIHLTEHERYVISHLHVLGDSLRKIARILGRHHSTISREVRRNSTTQNGVNVYWYYWAHPLAMGRRHDARHYQRQSNHRLVRYVENKLKEQWYPEEIANRICIDHPHDESMRVSHEIIYRWACLDASVDGEIYRNLQRGRERLRKQKRYGTGLRFNFDRKGIAERPLVTDRRQRYGDWEGDTVEGKKSTGYIATLVERKSRYLLAGKMENKKAATLVEQGVKAFACVPKKMRKTLTVDNGKEFSGFKKFEKKSGLAIYLADPYAAWQRGASENTNGLLRPYFPKGSNFKKVTEENVAEAVRKLNNRPRKCLGYRTPHEVFWKEARGVLAI